MLTSSDISSSLHLFFSSPSASFPFFPLFVFPLFTSPCLLPPVYFPLFTSPFSFCPSPPLPLFSCLFSLSISSPPLPFLLLPFSLPSPPSLPSSFSPFNKDEDFDSAGGLLGSSMKRVKNMAKAGHNRWMCYMILFIVAVFFVCYYIIKWRSS